MTHRIMTGRTVHMIRYGYTQTLLGGDVTKSTDTDTDMGYASQAQTFD